MAGVICKSGSQTNIRSGDGQMDLLTTIPSTKIPAFAIPGGDFDCLRRASFASSSPSTENDIFSVPSGGTNSPATPETRFPFTTIQDETYLKTTSAELGMRETTCNLPVTSFEDDQNWWMATNSAELGALQTLGTFDELSEDSFTPGCSAPYHPSFYQPLSNPAMNPPLSRPIFSGQIPVPSTRTAAIGTSLWTRSSVTPQPQTIIPSAVLNPVLIPSPLLPDIPLTPATFSSPRTIAPSVAFQPTMTSSPDIVRPPMTPLRESNNLFLLSSSPSIIISPKVVPSQREMDNQACLKSDFSVELSPDDMTKFRRATSRLCKRQYAKKGSRALARALRTPASKSGMDCPEIIPQNEFACKYKDCIDKATGKQKKFKRQEHKKRHEKTVHEKDRHHQFSCWVPGCKTKPFSRTDNLKSHLKKTHGKKSAAARNRYVATQDENSPFFDPEWVGALTAEGYPIFESNRA